MATIPWVSTANILSYKYFKSYSFTAKEKVSNFILDISRIFYHYKIVLSLFATEINSISLL